MARGRPAFVEHYQLDIPFHRLLRYVYLPRLYSGWDAIREFMGLMGFGGARGLTKPTLQKWCRERGFPVMRGRGKIPPSATDLAMVAWALKHYSWYRNRPGQAQE